MKITLKAGPFELTEDIPISDDVVIHNVTIDLTDSVLNVIDGKLSVEDLRIARWNIVGEKLPRREGFEMAKEVPFVKLIKPDDELIVSSGEWEMEILG